MYVASASDRLPALSPDEFLHALAAGTFRNIVVLTGAGISTAAGIPDYRSKGSGIFQQLSKKFGERFTFVQETPERLFSRQFVNENPHVWRNELLPQLRSVLENAKPTLAHKLCAHFYKKGWLRRIYTQNIDGLHTYHGLGIPENKVVECHGSIWSENLVLYGDALPERFFKTAAIDFNNQQAMEDRVDLVMVMGSSLEVAPFCALPNMAPRRCTRVLVDCSIQHVLSNGYSPNASQVGSNFTPSVQIGSQKRVPLRSLWSDRKASKKWRQILIQEECDEFAMRYCKLSGLDL